MAQDARKRIFSICHEGQVCPSVPASDQYPLHVVETRFVAPTVIELGGAGACVVDHCRGLPERSAVVEIRRDAGSRDCLSWSWRLPASN